MIFASPDHSPVLRVERYVPKANKPAWAQAQLSKLEPFSEWGTEEERSTEQCRSYIEVIVMPEAIARGKTIYMLEEKSAELAVQKPTTA